MGACLLGFDELVYEVLGSGVVSENRAALRSTETHRARDRLPSILMIENGLDHALKGAAVFRKAKVGASGSRSSQSAALISAKRQPLR